MTPFPPLPPAVVVHGITQARFAVAAAVAAGVPVTLLSAPGAAAHAGPPWFRALAALAAREAPTAEIVAVLDCGDRAGDAQAALADGVERIVFTGADDVAHRLDDIARQRGAQVLTSRPPALDPRGERDPSAACRAWLEGAGPSARPSPLRGTPRSLQSVVRWFIRFPEFRDESRHRQSSSISRGIAR